MTRFFRVSVGKNATYLDDALAHNYVGTGWLATVDLTGKFSDDWREFNKAYGPLTKEIDSIESNIAAGLACGQTWTLGKSIAEGDVVLVPTGQGSYRIARVRGPYKYQPERPLPHTRPVDWLPDPLAKSAMTEALQRSLGSSGTIVVLDSYVDELTSLIGDGPGPITSTDPEIENPLSFVLERHLEDFLVTNWPHTLLGATHDIYRDESGDMIGRQYPTDTGPIDILALSKDGTEVLVVELKRGRVSDVVVGQILRYMGFVTELEPGKTVRGVVIGLEDDPRFRRALSMVPNVSFMRYEVKFRLTQS